MYTDKQDLLYSHWAAIRKDKSTTKVQIAYDASAKSKNELSLNDCSYKGPKFDQNIMDMWLIFRCYPVAITADICCCDLFEDGKGEWIFSGTGCF